MGQWFDKLRTTKNKDGKEGKKVVENPQSDPRKYQMQIPKTDPDYDNYADTNHYKIWMHYKSHKGDMVDGPACACSDEFEHKGRASEIIIAKFSGNK